MWSALLMTLLLVPQQTGGRGGVIGAVGGRAISLELTLAAPVQLPDGRVLGASVRIPPGPTQGGDPWFVYSRGSLCDSSITRGSAPADATEGWRISIVERLRTPQQLIVAVTWLRMWERGRLVAAGSGGTSELTLKSGDRIPLDQITRPSASGDCSATQKSLELRVDMRLAPGTLSRVDGSVTTTTEPDAPLESPVAAELWLVHQSPDGTEAVEHQTVRLAEGGVGFLFRGLPVDSADGPMLIEVTGQLRAVQRADGTRALWAGLTRSVTHQATGRLRSSGSTGGTTVDWLAPGDVVSFDLPAPSVYTAPAGGRGGGGGGAVVGGIISARGQTGGGVATGGTGAGGAARSGGTGGATATIMAQRGPNLLEGHRLSVRIRIIESK